RCQRMVLRDRNHPSIIAWSLGNESYFGPHHAAMRAWARHLDPGRPVQYESGSPGPEVSDLMVPMYPKEDWVRKVMLDKAETRPMVCCEYAYAKGNAGGNFHKFWQWVETYPSFQGGFVWDWSEKALLMKVKDKYEYAYGGDFDGGVAGDGYDYGRKENPQMCLNGVVMPDLRPKPGAYEIKQCQAPVGLSVDPSHSWGGVNKVRIGLHNKYLTLDLSHLELCWSLLENGEIVRQGRVPCPALGPEQREELPVEWPETTLKADAVYHLNAEVILREACEWAPAGHVVAWDQWECPFINLAHKPRPLSEAKLRLQEDGELCQVAGENFTVAFSKLTGSLQQLQWAGQPLLSRGVEALFMRARTDNDYMINNPSSYCSEWQKAGLPDLEISDVKTSAGILSDGSVLFSSALEYTAQAASAHVYSRYQVHGDASMDVDIVLDVRAVMQTLPRVGISFALDSSFQNLAFFGRGPHENYIDRKNSARMGVFGSTVADQFFPFIDPCETGNHCDTRWFALSGDHGLFKVSGRPDFSFSALPYHWRELSRASHVHELQPSDKVEVILDAGHLGLGGDTGWTRNVHPEYLLKPGTYALSFSLKWEDLKK
ncbi:MAG: DUF4981 domain-containing protein, partial [Planctomycetes bacterium]|nr:DUF4981 domain-containing protein [Planctomycetota bacterium]